MLSILNSNYADLMKVTPFWIQRQWRYPDTGRECRGWMGQIGLIGFRWDYDRWGKIFWTINRWGIDLSHDLCWLWPWKRKHGNHWQDWSCGSFHNLTEWRNFWRGYFNAMSQPQVDEPEGGEVPLQ